MSELDVINFTNIDRENFDGQWGGKITVIKVGQTLPFPRFLAEHYCKHLVNKMLIRNGVSWDDKALRKPLEDKILGQVSVPVEEEPVEAVKSAEPEFAEVPKEEPKIETKVEAKPSEITFKCPNCDYVSKSERGLKVHSHVHSR